MYGWTGKILRVNLSNGSSVIQDIHPDLLHQFLGGRGLGAYFVYTEVAPDCDPLGPENILAFCSGSLTGIRVPTGGRSSMSTLSPLTGTIFDSNSGSPFGVRLKWAGFDALIITGQARDPVWLEITSDGAKYTRQLTFGVLKYLIPSSTLREKTQQQYVLVLPVKTWFYLLRLPTRAGVLMDAAAPAQSWDPRT